MPLKFKIMNSNKINEIKAKILKKLHRHGYWGGRHTSFDNLPKGFVDYSSLEIRHRGSIYEGILEYRLLVSDREMAAVKEKGKEL